VDQDCSAQTATPPNETHNATTAGGGHGGVTAVIHLLGLARVTRRATWDEFLLAATAQNLRKLAKLIPFPAPTFASGGVAGICLADSAASPKCWRHNRGFFNKIRRLLPSPSRKDRPFADGLANGPSRPEGDFQVPPLKGEKREKAVFGSPRPRWQRLVLG
jgi:hypothetical protein